MSNQYLKLRRSAVPGRIPTTSSIEFGEIALNTYDGKAYMKKSGSSGEEIIVIGSTSGSFSGSFVGSFTGSLFGTASWANNAISSSFATSASQATTASYVLNAVSASFADTASSADNFTVRGTLTAQTIVAQTITSSTDFVSGSTRFGSLLSNTHQFTGSVSITGSLSLPYLSTGSVLFAGTNGAVSQNNSNFFWDNVNGRLGVGTNAPEEIFTIQSTNPVLRIRENNSTSTNTPTIRILNSVNNQSNIYLHQSNYTSVNRAKAGQFNITNNGAGGIVLAATSTDSTATIDFVTQAFPSAFASILSARISNVGNFLLGFATDSGERLQVSGSTKLSGNTVITGSLTVITGSNIEFQVLNTGVKIGNLTTDTHTVTGSLSISGSVTATNFTGSLFGTASWANNAISSSYILQAVSASFATSASQASTASFVNPLNQQVIITGSLIQGLEGNIATGEYSHAEGSITKAIGDYSHAEGDFTQAKGNYSHAEGQETIASGSYSHAEGLQTIALANHQHVQGQYNSVSSVPSAFIVGNGTDDSNRSNLIYAAENEVQISGSLKVSGSITGSLFGTASWADNAISSSYILQAVSASFATSASQAISASYALNAKTVESITGSQYFVPVFNSTSSLITSSIYDSGSFTAIGATTPVDPSNPDRLFIDAGNTTSYNLFSGHGSINNYLQLNVQNFSSAATASSDIVATADNGSEDNFYVNMGINSSGYSITDGVGSANDSYLFNTGGDLLIGNASTNKRVIIFNGGIPALDNARIYITQQGTVGINNSDANNNNPEALLVEPLPGTPSNTFSNLIIGRGTVHESYLQLNIINQGSGSYASADIVASNDISTETSNYVDMGINSSNHIVDTTFAPGGPNDTYLLSTGRDLLIGSSTSGSITLWTGTNFDDKANAKLTLRNNNQHSLTGSLNVSGSITGSLFGTASFATTASIAISASFATTASYALNAGAGSGFPFSGSAVITGSLLVSGSGLTVTGSLSTLGTLNLNNARFNSTSSITPAGAIIVSSNATGSSNSAFYNYSISSGSNARAGQIMSVWSGSTIRYTEVTTTDLGNTNSALFAVGISGTNVQLQFTSSGVWTVKSIVNLL
jgi:hypothetical protein